MEQKNGGTQINLKSFWRILKIEKWVILSIVVLFGLIGVKYSLSLRNEFLSTGKILPEIQSRGAIGQFAGLAALAGVDLSGVGGGADAIRPDLYPDVLKSTEFFLSLFKEKIKDRSDNELTFHDYYMKEVLEGKSDEKDQKVNYPESDNYLSFNKQTEKNIKDLKKRITCTYDKRVGLISISVKMPDPVVAANVASLSMDYLTKYIIDYRTKKQKNDLEFLEGKLFEAKKRHHNNQSVKANYGDQMPLKALRLQSADLQRERIESDYKISSTVYNTLLQKYEETKFRLQQETPVIQVLDPPVVSNYKSEPKRLVKVMTFLFIGIFLSIAFVFIKHFKKIVE